MFFLHQCAKMFEEDPLKTTVYIVQFEKYVPFCMPGAEGTLGNAAVVTWSWYKRVGWGGIVCDRSTNKGAFADRKRATSVISKNIF